jgi:hypothetical protein
LFFIWVCAILTKVNCWRLFQPSAPTAHSSIKITHTRNRQTRRKDKTYSSIDKALLFTWP